MENITEVQTPEAGANGNGTVETAAPENSNVDIQAMIDKSVNDSAELYKKEIAGLNRKNSEMEKLLKDKELEGKTEEEKNEALKAENKEIAEENAKLVRDGFVDKSLNSAGLPLKLAGRIIGEDEANIEKDVNDLKEYINELAQEKANAIVNEKLGGNPPKAGASPTAETITREQFNNMSPDEVASAMERKIKIV